ncbi:hypothetical protein [Streptomyces sp. NPDC048508]|uniref:hypothetical protein n=1 Tax=Streptomyces sp. NPDC048508 TaxID=3365561 RepID=UPI003718DAFB
MRRSRRNGFVLAAFWISFAVPIHQYPTSNRQAFPCGYGHYFILGSATAVGSGFEVAVEQATHQAHLSTRGAKSACRRALGSVTVGP